jgi:DNA-binding transcriptional LysR family regulator
MAWQRLRQLESPAEANYDRGEMIELRHLRYFVAVAEELNFSRAAERLHMAQPPLSVAIRQLEQELGTELLARTTREVRLTDAGQAFLNGARRTLIELERAESDARRTAAGELGRLRVGFSWSERFETLPKLGQAFRADHPHVAMLTEEMWNAKMPGALRSGSIDVAISLCPEVVADCSYLTLRREPVAALLAASHHAAESSSISLETLADDRFLMFPREFAPRLHDFMVGLCRRAGFEPQIGSESFHAGWELQILADIPVVALVPASVERSLPDGIVAVRVDDPSDPLETALVWRADDNSATTAAFREIARSAFAIGATSN